MRSRRTVPRACQACGRDFSASVYDAGRFCSRRCYWNAKKGTGRPLADRFWEKVDTSGDCWMWQGKPGNHGYGRIQLEDGTVELSHRASWLMHNGAIGDAHVCHTCDIKWPPGDITYRRCVNPAHLFLGTNDDNQADKVAKQRQASGDRSGPRLHPERMARGVALPQSKLTDAIVREMRRRYAAGGIRLIDLADEYDISLTATHKVIHRETWTHVI